MLEAETILEDVLSSIVIYIRKFSEDAETFYGHILKVELVALADDLDLVVRGGEIKNDSEVCSLNS